MIRPAQILLSFFIFLTLFTLYTFPSFATANLLTNPGFEDGTNGWTKYPSTATFEATSSAVKSGNYSGLITKKSAKGYARIFQEFEATPSAYYKFSGWALFDDEDINNVKLRIDWRDKDGNRVELAGVEAPARSPDFQYLELVDETPAGVATARVECYVYLSAANPSNPALFDDLIFEPWVAPEPPPPPVYSSEIFLNEIMPNPEGSDTDNEYLELYNAGDEEVDLSNWVIKDLTGDKIIGSEIALSSTLIPARGFLVIYKKDGSVSLNNGGDTITLLNPADEIVDEITYPEVDEGWVYQRYPDGNSSWSESNQPTAGAANKPSSSSSTSSNDPEVTFSVEGSDFKVNQSFDVKVTIKNAKGLHDYYVKIRLGLEEGKLSKGRTHNSRNETWLADNASWTKFPVVYTAADGTESLTFSAKAASGNPADTYIIGVRIRDKETEKNYDSETQKITVGEEEASNGENDDDGAGAVLGVATELPATGGGLTSLLVTAWLPVLGWMILIFLGSSTHGVSVSESRTVDFIAHKIVHLFEYSVLFILIHHAVKRTLKVVSKLHAVAGKLGTSLRSSQFASQIVTLVSFVLTVGYAITDEIHQSFVPGRDARLTDVLIDAGAALLAWLVLKRSKVSSYLQAAAMKLDKNSKVPHILVFLSLLLLTSSSVFSVSHLSFAVPDGYELKEGEIDHLGGTLEIFDTRGAAISFKPDFNFDLAGFATFVYSYEKHYGELDPSDFTLSIYEKAMEHSNLDDCWICKARPSEATIVEGSAEEGYTYQLFFSFEPIAVKGGEDYTAILTTTETTIGRYRFWIRSDYYDGFFLTFNPLTQEFSNPSSGHLGAPFGLFVEEGWQGTPPRFHPVVLIHGMGGRPSDWSLAEQDYVSLIREMYATDEDFDYPSSWIHTYHYGNVGWEYNYQGDIREIALGLEDVVADLATRYAESFGETLESLEERDEDRVVDIVGYSMGGLVARQYLIKHQDNHHLRKLVTIATPHQGIYWLGRKESIGTFSRFGPRFEEAISGAFDATITVLDKTGQPVSSNSEAAFQMTPNSEFLDYLNMVEWAPLDVQYYTIYGDIDVKLKEKIFFFTMEKRVALGDVLMFSESAVGIPAVEPKQFGYNEEWTFPIGVAVTPDGVSAKFYLEGLDITKFRFWHLGILHQPEIKEKTVSILANEI